MASHQNEMTVFVHLIPSAGCEGEEVSATGEDISFISIPATNGETSPQDIFDPTAVLTFGESTVPILELLFLGTNTRVSQISYL